MKPTSIQGSLPDQRSCRGPASTPGHQRTGRRMCSGFGSLLMWYFLATLFHACSGQNAPGAGNRYLPATFAGDTVSGLSDAIMVVYQDQRNNYWFGSRGQGVFRYDGRHLLQFTTKHGLVSNDIWGIQEDKSGHIYFDTQEGVGKFDGQTFSILQVSPSVGNAWKLEPDDLWFKGNWNVNGPYRYDGNNLYHLEFPPNELADQLHKDFPEMTWSPYGIYSLYKDRKGHVWFGTSNLGIYRFDGTSLRWMYEKHLTDIEETGGSFGIRSMLEDRAGDFWFCNTRYRYHILPSDTSGQNPALIPYNRKKGIDNLTTPDGKDLIYFMSAIEDNTGNMWLVTYAQGVWQYDGKNITRHPVKIGDKEIKLFSIYKDHHGDLWLGTHEAGAFRFNGREFEQFRP